MLGCKVFLLPLSMIFFFRVIFSFFLNTLFAYVLNWNKTCRYYRRCWRPTCSSSKAQSSGDFFHNQQVAAMGTLDTISSLETFLSLTGTVWSFLTFLWRLIWCDAFNSFGINVTNLEGICRFDVFFVVSSDCTNIMSSYQDIIKIDSKAHYLV